jgi:hypothetical protein
MKTRLPLLLFAASCSVAPAQPPADQLAWSTETVIAVPELVRSPDDSSGGALIGRAASIRANARAIVVADVSDDQILILDSTGKVTRSFGSRGRGPGELLGASHISLRQNSVLIGEAQNGRVSEFSYDGEFIGTYVVGFAAGAVSADEQRIFTASRSSEFYASVASADGAPTDAFQKPRVRLTGADKRWTRLTGHDLLVSDSNRTWIFDQIHGSLCAYTTPDGAPRCLRLPQPILERLRRYRAERVERLEAVIQMRVEAAPLAKDMIFAGQYIAILLPLPDIPILLVDATDAKLTPVMTVGSPLPDWARSARSFAWDGRAFLLIGDDGLGRLRLSTLNGIVR